MAKAAFLAIDWGTTNRRIYTIGADGRALKTERDDRGVLAVSPGAFADDVTAIRATAGDLPVLCAGMVGSNRGWIDAGYVACSATLEKLAKNLLTVAPGVQIVPGVSYRMGRRADVMRGEEVQFLGAVAADLVPATSLLCQPGTHAKWARMEGGSIASFTTAMTGEMFSILQRHALIGSSMSGDVVDGTAFRDGVMDAARDDVLALLFGVRSASLLGLRENADAAAYVSGLLIGSDCRVRLEGEAGHVYLLADPGLGALYGAAIDTIGGTFTMIDSHEAFVAGISCIWELAR